ncbi:sulfotransferase domain-containing protein [Roseovarius sp. M141]|uniref:sulfotransferase domain-containing protein n=1 Tax=Roseovarius sp. M141 TaxID=2583806 RepID=UPI0020CE9EC7|nr:sulfotransferase domain-containing protein [Roseovarius sp. M141]MCQ0093751.1 sulfotransferase domain-containing protein [Roseovarius sp. M141]
MSKTPKKTSAKTTRPAQPTPKASIVWLASYPKSGNTWTRIFLANYLMNTREPVSINQVHRFGMGDSIAKTYRMVAKDEAADLEDVNVTLRLRDRVLRGIIGNGADVNLVKTHNIRSAAYGTDLIPAKYTRSSVYIMRNPLDMVLSYARHYGITAAEAIDVIGRSDNANASDTSTVWQFLGSWSEHVNSWTADAPYPSLVLRYEDMLNKPERAFGALVQHLGVPLDPERLQRAIRFSSFDEAKGQEAKAGFAENPGKNKTFFTSGKAGGWKDELSDDLVAKLRTEHHDTMKRFGYL